MPDARDFPFALFYQPETLRYLREAKRRDLPEHTEADPRDPLNAMIGLMALVSHLQAVRTDHVAREGFVGTARLRSSMIALGAAVDYRLAGPTPAEAELLATLTTTWSGSQTVIRAHSQFGTSGGLVYEYDSDEDLTVEDPGTLTIIEDDGGTLSEYVLGDSLWGGAPASGDALYFGHPSAMFDGFDLEQTSTGGVLVVDGVWEYYDDLREVAPDRAVPSGGNIVFSVNTALTGSETIPAAPYPNGASVVVTCLRTGVSQTLTTSGNATQIATSSGLMGQTVASSNAADYLVRVAWPMVPDLTEPDGVAANYGDIDTDGAYGWTIPQDADRRWASTEVNGTSGYWVRYRVVSVSVGSLTRAIDSIDASASEWAVLADIRQGRRVEEILGVATGAASESWTLASAPLISIADVSVNDESWSEVRTFLDASPFDRVYTAIEQPDETVAITFGDGERGRLLPAAATVRVAYRVGGDVSGDVDPGAINRDRTGNSRVRSVTNPRAASGWVAAEGSTEADLNRLRAAIPASLRTRGRAVTADDVAALAIAFRTADGSAPVARVLALEEGAGPKTVQIVAVGPGGLAPSAADLVELEEYFRGTTLGWETTGGVALANMQVEAVGYTPNAIDATVTLYVKAGFGAAAEVSAPALLRDLLSPLAVALDVQADGTLAPSEDWQWSWGGTVTEAAISARLVLGTRGAYSATFSGFSTVILASDELPVPGTITVSVVEAS